MGPSIGLSVRSEARASVERYQKGVAAAKKALAAARSSAGLKALETHLTSDAMTTSSPMVLEVDLGADSKALGKAVALAQKLLPSTPVLLLTKSDGKVLAAATVPQVPTQDDQELHLGNLLRADEWVKAAVAPLGGRGGGKADSAQGQGKAEDSAAGAEAVKDAAVAFLASLPSTPLAK